MRWFFIWLIILPLHLYGQSDLEISINDMKGCDCDTITTDNLKVALEYINSDPVNNALTACYYHCIGIFFYNKGNHVKAINLHEEALKIRGESHKEFVWKSYYMLGLAYRKLEMFQKSQLLMQIAHNTFGKKRPRDSMSIFRMWAENLTEIGELQQAEKYSTEATKIPESCMREADAYNTLAFVLGWKAQDTLNLEKAIKSANIAIYFYEQANAESAKIGQALNNKAIALGRLGRYDEAIKIYELALDKYDEDSEAYAEVLNNIGHDLGKQEAYVEAIEILNQSLQHIKAYYENTPFQYTYAADHENLAENHEALGNYDKALNHYQDALQNLTTNFRKTDIHQNPIPSDTLYVYNKIDLIRILHLKASAAFKKYQKEGDKTYLDLAQKTYNTAFDFHNQLPQQISTQESRLFQAEVIVPFIENALAVAYELQETQEQTPETAYRFMEKNKATVLMQAINEADALRYAGLPKNLLEQEKELRESITAYEKQLNNARQYEGKGKVKQYENLLFEQKNTYDQLIQNLETNHPEYYKLKYKQNTSTLKDAQNYLDNETAILEYFVGDSSIYVLAIEKSTAHLHRLEKPENWSKTLNDFRTFIADANTGLSFADNAHQLYEWLISKPLNDLNTNIKRLQIIPDAQLNYLPFGLLLTEDDSQKTNYDLSYLLKEKSISYAYSAALLLEEKEKQNTTKYLYGGFAPEYDGTEHDNLPEGRKNVEVQSKKLKGKSYLADQATKNQFKDKADQFQILHLSMHGILDDENPLYSKLIFANNEPLHALDLYNTRLNADLAILSACNTGTGEIKKGEGVMSLSRAFTYAGCPSLLMSLWSVPDKSTADIMTTFLEELKKGKTKDKALQIAQLNYLDNASTTQHPVHWAGFVPSGDMQAVKFNQTCTWWWAALLILCVVLYFGRRAIRS